MQALFAYFQDFFQAVNRSFFVFCTLLAAVLVWANYRWGIEPRWLAALQPRPLKFMGFYCLYLLAFGLPWLFYLLVLRAGPCPPALLVFLLLAPAVFALKVSAGGWQEWLRTLVPGNGGRYLALVSDWPIRLLLTLFLVMCLRWLMDRLDAPPGTLGFGAQRVSWSTYGWLLAAMAPLVVFAASQPAFLQAYPKLRAIFFLPPGASRIAGGIGYELSYGSDFFTIELFFRGLLVVWLCRWMGPAAILPMAVFYCSIHFGKPLLECVSSYFGGMILGVLACYSESILGGIVVHLGLAWMMEAAALASSYIHTNN